MKPIPLCILLSLGPVTFAFAQVVSYDAASGVFPEAQGWERSPFCTPERWLEGGFLHVGVEVGECGPPPGGDRDFYGLPIDDFIGVDQFFVEWRMFTDAAEPWNGSPGAILNVFNFGGEQWWFGFARDEMEFFQDDFVVLRFFDVGADVPHTYRLQIINLESYTIYIDGELVWEGTLGDEFPSFAPSVTWMTRAWTMDNLTQWQYVRFGVPGVPASGDIDGSGVIDDDDLFYFEECLSTEAGDWIGCDWANMDAQGGVDCSDAALFVQAWGGRAEPPVFEQCSTTPCPADLDNSASIDAADLALLLGAWGPNPGHAADFNMDGSVDAADLAQLLGNWGSCSK